MQQPVEKESHPFTQQFDKVSLDCNHCGGIWCLIWGAVWSFIHDVPFGCNEMPFALGKNKNRHRTKYTPQRTACTLNTHSMQACHVLYPLDNLIHPHMHFLCHLVHAFMTQLQALLNQVAIHKVAAWPFAHVSLEHAPRFMTEAANTMNDCA